MAKIVNYKEPKSSFMGVDKDMALISKAMLQNVRLKRLLYEYPINPDDSEKERELKANAIKDPLNARNLTEEESTSLFGKNIKITPKLTIDNNCYQYVIISFDNFLPNGTNPEFRDNIINFDIICHFSRWEIANMQLRPYKIAAELDEMFNGKHLTGIGTLQFLGANQVILNNEFAGLTLSYSAIHGEEDKNFNQDKRNLISEDEAVRYKEDFINTYNSDEWIID